MSRRRGRRRRPRFVPLSVIDELADAIDTAFGLVALYPHAHAVFVTDSEGAVRDMWVFRGQRHTAEDAIGAGLEAATRVPDARRAVLVSVMENVDLLIPNELEVEMWRSTVARFAEAGLVLWEWVVASGTVVRSLAVTAETEPSWRRS